MENYFAVLELPESLEVAPAELKRRYLERSRAAHPDHHTQATAEEQTRALAQSALLNQAFKTLNTFEGRLQHLLQLHGLLGADGQNQTDQQLDPEFLMEMMELNEQVEELDPAAEDQQAEALAQLNQRLEANQQAILQLLPNLAETPEDQKRSQLEAALPHYLQRQYLLRLKQRLA